jgi:hypothetical protein
VGEERVRWETDVAVRYVRLNVLVEGFTEETVVRTLLAPALATQRIYAIARSVETSTRHGAHFRGGLSKYAKARRDIVRWLAEDRGAYLTTMFDLYHLPVDFPGLTEAKRLTNCFQRAAHLEAAAAADVPDKRFIPYVQLHEFEGLLFSDIGEIDLVLSTLGAGSHPRALATIRDAFPTPEEIDDGEDSAPSKRLLALYPAYDKVVFGALIAERIGLTKMRAACPHFHGWLTKLEALPKLGGDTPGSTFEEG